jgi:hypothetical protein
MTFNQARIVQAATLLVAACATQSAVAVELTVFEPFVQYFNVGTNTLGVQTGPRIRYGASSVTADQPGLISGRLFYLDANGINSFVGIPHAPSPAFPDFYSGSMPFDPAIGHNFTVRFNYRETIGGPILAIVDTPITQPSLTEPPPLIHSISMSGSGLTPTFTWTPPPGVQVDAYRINILDKSLRNNGNSGQVVLQHLPATQTSYTVDPAHFEVPGYEFTIGTNYSLNISLLQLRNPAGEPTNSNVYALSRVFADFTAIDVPVPQVSLPAVNLEGGYQFNVQIEPDTVYYLDPPVAVGYVFQTGVGDPNFRSVTLPLGIGDNLYDIYAFDGDGNPHLVAEDWAGGALFDFGAAGVSNFQILGIETSVGIDPENTTAFIAGFTFTGPGQFTGSQTPIIENVPEPHAMTLLLSGLGVLWMLRGRHAGPRRHVFARPA